MASRPDISRRVPQADEQYSTSPVLTERHCLAEMIKKRVYLRRHSIRNDPPQGLSNLHPRATGCTSTVRVFLLLKDLDELVGAHNAST